MNMALDPDQIDGSTLIRIMRTISSFLIVGDLGSSGSFSSSLTKRDLPSNVCEQTISASGLLDSESIYSRSDADSLI